jgi:hypothetical protein
VLFKVLYGRAEAGPILTNKPTLFILFQGLVDHYFEENPVGGGRIIRDFHAKTLDNVMVTLQLQPLINCRPFYPGHLVGIRRRRSSHLSFAATGTFITCTYARSRPNAWPTNLRGSAICARFLYCFHAVQLRIA